LAEQQRRGAYLGLAAASALVVLVASVVAVNRIVSDDGPDRARPQVAAAPLDQGSGSVSTPNSTVTADAESAVASPDRALASASTTSSGTTRKAVRARGGSPSPATGPSASDDPSADPSAGPASTGTTSGQPAADSPSGSGGPPAGEQPPSGEKGPDNAPLVAASVSAGQGDQGGVVGLGFSERPDADVTVGTTQVVGDAPPSSGTGVGLGGGIFDPPPTIPILPG
jgi:hypothetical protein